MTRKPFLMKLRELATRVAQGDQSANTPFREALLRTTDGEGLKSIAEELTTSYQVAVPLYQRVLQLAPEDVSARAQLGFVHWLFGEDDLARAELQRGQAEAPKNVDVLLLSAALEPDASRQKEIYREVLRLDPDNRFAKQNLGMASDR